MDWRSRWAKRLGDPIYNGILIVTTLAYSLILYAIDDYGTYTLLDDSNWIELPAFILTICYLLDLIANFVVLGPTRMW